MSAYSAPGMVCCELSERKKLGQRMTQIRLKNAAGRAEEFGMDALASGMCYLFSLQTAK